MSKAQHHPRGIIWLASYPRSGNTWTRNFLYNLLSIVDGRDRGGHDVNRLADTSVWDIAGVRFERALGEPLTVATRHEIAGARPAVQKAIADGAKGPILVKTHNALVLDRGTPTITMGVTAGAVYIVRNPLDVVISYAHHFDTSIDESIRLMGLAGAETGHGKEAAYEVYGSWSENVMSWTRKPHRAILVLRYEDMLARPAETFRKLAGHLLIVADDTQIAKAIERSDFKIAQAQEKEKGYRERPLQSKAFFREGRAGQWRDVLSQEQIARLIADHREQMERFGYIPEGH